MRKKNLRCLAVWLLLAALLLSGCGPQGGVATQQSTLPPAAARYTAPENDVNQGHEQTVLLYLPSRDGSQLVAVPQTASLSASRHNAQTLCEMLLSHPGTDSAAPLGGEVALSLSETEAVEVSGRVATVSLSASALRLTYEELFTVGQALANTLGQLQDVDYVNVLIAGAQTGLNVASTLPAGCFSPNTAEDLPTLWARLSSPSNTGRRAFTAALYFPAPGGKGILCEARTLSFSALDLPSMALTLLDALAAGAEELPSAPRCEELRSLLLGEPALEESGGQRRLVFRFAEQFNDALLDAGITRSVMMASLTYTMTTFLPGIEGIEVYIGEDRVNTITPSGIYSTTGQQMTITFSDGLMRRKDFPNFLLSFCTLYFAGGSGKLTKVYRPVPYYQAYSARALLEELMLGPQPFDTPGAVLQPVLPEGLRSADLLGVAFEENTVVLNFSIQLSALCQGMSPGQEKCLVYAVVNTLCELEAVKKVAFFIQGEQPETLAGSLYLPGDFLPDADLVE